MRATLADLLQDARAGGFAIPCFNVFGFEDAVAYIEAAETSGASIILATNKEMVEFMGVERLAHMLGTLADESNVNVCIHLDHCYEESTVYAAVDAGYSSVMFDGSQLPLEENIERTRHVVEYAKSAGTSVEGEIGSVPYTSGRDHIKSMLTSPDQAARFAEGSGVDAVAISVGNVHRMQEATASIDTDAVRRIAAKVSQPLVIHGTTGIPRGLFPDLIANGVRKFNIGTDLRKAFGSAMRDTLAASPNEFDRLTLFKPVMSAQQQEAARYIDLLRGVGENVAAN